VPVQTPQMRSTKAQASRGSRPLRMTSRPRHMVPVETALRMTLLSSRFTSTRMWPSMRVTGSTTTRLPELSSLKPWVSYADPCQSPPCLLSAGSCLWDARLMALTAAWATTAAPTTPAPCHPPCRRWIRRRTGDVGEAVVERALVPEAVFGAADAAVAGLDGEGHAAVPAHGGAGVVGGGALAAHLVEAVALARPRRPRPRRTGRRRSAGGGSTCRGCAGCRTSSGRPWRSSSGMRSKVSM
jgi:hypothetical protein